MDKKRQREKQREKQQNRLDTIKKDAVKPEAAVLPIVSVNEIQFGSAALELQTSADGCLYLIAFGFNNVGDKVIIAKFNMTPLIATQNVTDLHNVLEEYRVTNNITLKDMANAMDLSLHILHKIEHGIMPAEDWFKDRMRISYPEIVSKMGW